MSEDQKSKEEVIQKTDDVLDNSSERIQNFIMAFSLSVMLRSSIDKLNLEGLYKLKFKTESLMQILARGKEALERELQDLTKLIAEKK